MSFEHTATLLRQRAEARALRNWALSDFIRDQLDSMGIFVMDMPDGSQYVRRIAEDYFRHMDKAAQLHGIVFSTRRKYLEWRMRQDAQAEQRFNAWLYSMQESIKARR